MKFTVSRERMVDALGIVGEGVGRWSYLPVLSCVLLKAQDGRLELRATNLEVGVRWVLDDVEIESEGSVCVEYRRLYKWLKAPLTSDVVKLTLSEKVTKGEGPDAEEVRTPLSLRAQCGRNSCTMKNVHPEEDFPTWSGAEPLVSVGAEELTKGIGQVVWAAATEYVRNPTLEGVHMALDTGVMTLQAADGFKLAEAKVDVLPLHGYEPTSAVVNRQAMGVVAKVAEGQVRIGVGDGRVIFKMDAGPSTAPFDPAQDELRTGEVVGTTIEGAFPDVANIFGQAEKGAIVRRANRRELARMAGIAAQFATHTHSAGPYILIEWCEGECKVSAQSVVVGDYRGMVDVGEGDDIKLALSPHFIKGALDSLSGDEAEFVMSEPKSPVLLREDSHRVVVMPMEVRG